MPRQTDARARALETAERLFRIQGYAATGLSQILEESGAPKGSFYFHFPRGKAQLAAEAIDRYIAARASVMTSICERTKGDAQGFFDLVYSTLAAEMVATDFRYGCLMQNLANELVAPDAELTLKIASGFAVLTEIAAEHLRACGFSPARASSMAAALSAAIEGARTIARLERTPAVFEALASIRCQS